MCTILLRLLSADLAKVELELLALQDVAIRPSDLSRPARNSCKEATALELLDEMLLDFGRLLTEGVLLLRPWRSAGTTLKLQSVTSSC